MPRRARVMLRRMNEITLAILAAIAILVLPFALSSVTNTITAAHTESLEQLRRLVLEMRMEGGLSQDEARRRAALEDRRLALEEKKLENEKLARAERERVRRERGYISPEMVGGGG